MGSFRYAVCFGVLLSSCSLAPRYHSPRVEVPDEWRFAGNGDSEAAVENKNNTQAIDINTEWWKQFNDEVLIALIDEALVYNQEIKIAINRVAEYYAKLGIARSELYPQIFGNASAYRIQPSYGGLPIPDSTVVGANDLFRLNVTLAYQLDIFGRVHNRIEAARADLYGEIDLRRGVILTVVAAVASGYVQLRELDLEKTIATDTLKSYQESYRLARLRYERGLTSELAVKQAESLIALAAAEVVRLERQIGEEENALSVLTGHPPAAIDRGLAVTEWPEPFGVPSGLPAELLFQRPDILAAEKALIATNARIGVARADYFPSIELTGLYGYESFALKNLFKNSARTWNYGASLVQPIFTGWLISSLVDEAVAINYEAYYFYEQTVLNAFQEVEDALLFYRKAKELYVVEYNRIKILKEVLHLASLQYENGQTDYLNVLDAERTLFDAQLDLAKAQGDIFLSLIEIYKALAGGWVTGAEEQVMSNLEATLGVCGCK